MKALLGGIAAAVGLLSSRNYTSDATHSSHVTIDVWTKNGTRNDTAPLLGGLFFEDISQSGDGGIYGELIRNRAFQGSGISMGRIPNIPGSSIVYSENPSLPFGPVLDGWSGIGDVRLSLDLLHPLSDSLQVALQVDVMTNATGKVGIQNDGWWGINVAPQKYDASFYATVNGKRFNWTISHFDVSLQSSLTGEVWSNSTIPVRNQLYPHRYSFFNATMFNKVKAPNINNTFAITMDAEEARGQTIYFDLVSLFGETYKGRKNGLRKDLAELLAEMKPRYLRFPGGNQLEGYSVQRRWKWWKTIGPLKDRPGRPGDWTYYNTDGLGLLEYLEWCEDMEIEPLLAVYDGFSLDIFNYDFPNSTDANEFPIDEMSDVLEEVLGELEYCMGSTATYWGRQRAAHGHPEPFKINMIQIGNEGWFSHWYHKRAEYLYRGLKEHYPHITYVYSALNESREFYTKVPDGAIWDHHMYAPMKRFIREFDYYDHFQEHEDLHNVGVGLMEYHASLVLGHGNSHPRMGAAVAEAVYHIGGERNPRAFRLSAFAPLIQNLNAYRHTPYNILFTSDPDQTVLSASYYQQQMFNRYHGTETLATTTRRGGFKPLFWVASIQDPEREIYVKVANTGNTPEKFDIKLDIPFHSVNGTVLQPPRAGDALAHNDMGRHEIFPRDIEGLEQFGTWKGHDHEHASKFHWEVPAYSVAVLQFNLNTTDGVRIVPEVWMDEQKPMMYHAEE